MKTVFGTEVGNSNEVEITNITGKIIFKNKDLGKETNINLSGNTPGAYILRAIAGDQVYTRQIILR